ncbi:MAG: UvrD-helicase domain-containing protein [Bacteroidetes bacterium]|nr:UvrD-helicase domain-containing protein [Bacteroidota bacterium]
MSIQKQPFEIMKAPLTGINLVEASAGTGKTWNIEALTVRLMVERGMLPGDILVVTFTEAATQELRERIYKRLIEVIRVLKSPQECGDDPFLQACVEQYDAATHLRHLETCKQRFDEASISTIHGFCKTVLSEFSHLTRTDIDVTIETEGKGALVDDAVDDFWRQYNAREAAMAGGMLASLLYGPLKRDTLRKAMNSLLKQNDVKVLYPDPPQDIEAGNIRACIERLQDSIAEICAIWSRDKEVIRQQLADTKISHAGLDKYFEGIEVKLFEFLHKPFEFAPGGKRYDPARFGARFIEEGKLTKGNTYKSDHPVHALIDQALEIAAYIPDFEQRRALETIRTLYRDRCARDGVTTFDDLLRNVAEALRDDATENGGSGALHHGLRERYKAGLIDEFQDTDPVQFEIFRRIFIDDTRSDRLLYLIGDPKQAIYMFRGADLRTYIKAREQVEQQFTLEVNFRSAKNMVDGVNALFEGDNSFIDNDLSFIPATAHNVGNPFVSGVDEVQAGKDGNHNGLHFPKVGEGPYKSKVKATNAVAMWTATHIARSLEAARADGNTGFVEDITSRTLGSTDEITSTSTASTDDITLKSTASTDETTSTSTRSNDDITSTSISDVDKNMLGPGERSRGSADYSPSIKPLTAGDIAVLVSSNNQARMLKSRLEELGVPAVVGGDASIFSTDDARLMNLMLDVLVDPQRLSSIRTLLVSRLVGMDVNALESLLHDDLAWSGMLEIFAMAREEALQKGVLAGIRYLTNELKVEKRLISWSDGERRITNLRHISELLYEEQRRGHRNLAGLAQWLRSRRNDPNLEASDATQMRLESDENRVTIMTMHSSKGLQFPVVYAPFLWESRQKGGSEALYFDDEIGSFVLDFKNGYADRLAEVRGSDNDRAVRGQRLQDAANIEDRVRLLYVAVTRSKYRCYVPHAMVESRSKIVFQSPFTAMLLRDPAAGEIQWQKFEDYERATGIDAQDVITGLLEKLDTSRFCQYQGLIDYSARFRADAVSERFAERQLNESAVQAMQQHVFVESYSSLKTYADGAVDASEAMGNVDVSDTDSLSRLHKSPEGEENVPEEKDISDSLAEDKQSPASGHTIFSFPRGAHTGTFWHQIFEDIDFTDPGTFEPVVRKLCEEYGFDFAEWRDVLMNMVHRVVNADLDGFRLADIPAKRALREMEFYLPYDSGEMDAFLKWVHEQVSGEVLAVDDAKINTANEARNRDDIHIQKSDGLVKNIREGLPDSKQGGELPDSTEGEVHDVNVHGELRNAAASFVLHDQAVRHYLTGFIDLLVEHEGRYYIVDYKSDHLGDHIDTYQNNLLDSHMRKSGYKMQYYFYALALFIYLRDRIDGVIDFEQLFGGVRYLFIRGMDGNVRNGVFVDKPDAAMIIEFANKLQRLSQGDR